MKRFSEPIISSCPWLCVLRVCSVGDRADPDAGFRSLSRYNVRNIVDKMHFPCPVFPFIFPLLLCRGIIMGNNGAVHSSSCTYAIFDSGRRGGYQAAAQACQGARHDRAGDHRPRQYVRSQGVSRRGRTGGDQADSRLRGLRGRRQPLRQERQGRPGRPPDSAGQESGGVPQSFQNRVVCLYRGVLLPSPGRQGAAAPLSPTGLSVARPAWAANCRRLS